MFCPQCGAQSNDGDAFCSMCGSDLRQVAAQAPVEAPQPEPVQPPQPTPDIPPTVPMPVVTEPPVAPAPIAPAPMPPHDPGVPHDAYAKAPVGARLLAAMADSIVASALLPVGVLLVYGAAAKGETSVVGVILAIIGGLWEVAYLLGRDSFGGAGAGKRMTGLVVTDFQTGSPAPLGKGIIRQLILYMLSSLPLVGIVEPIMVLVDKDGRRLGDKVAKTQVARASEVEARGLMQARKKGSAVAFFLGALAISIIGSAIGGLLFARTISGVVDPGIPDTPAPTAESTQAAPTTTPSNASRAMVEAFYVAASQGNVEGIKATCVTGFAAGITPEMFEGWTSPNYAVTAVDEAREPGAVYVQVQEYDGGLSNGLVTFKLVQEDGSWKITAWVLGTIDDAAQSSGAESDPAATATPEQTAEALLNKETAVDTVGKLLDARRRNDKPLMESLTSAALKQADPGFFADASQAFSSFEVTDAFRDGGTFIVTTHEEWISGPDNVKYVCIVENGQLVVDSQIFDE